MDLDTANWILLKYSQYYLPICLIPSCVQSADNSDATLNYLDSVSPLNPLVQTHPRIKETMFFPPCLIRWKQRVHSFSAIGGGGEKEKEKTQSQHLDGIYYIPFWVPPPPPPPRPLDVSANNSLFQSLQRLNDSAGQGMILCCQLL